MRHGFTLIEIIVTVIIVLLLATLGMAGYHQILEKAKLRVCATNQQAIARTAQIVEFEAGILGELPLEELGRAYARAVEEGGWFTKFSYFFVRLNTPRQAYAAAADLVDPEKMKEYGLDPQIFICPADRDGPPSYGVNSLLEGIKWEDLPAGTIIVGDCKTATFTDPSELDSPHFVIPIINPGGETQVTTKEGMTFVAEPENIEECVNGGAGESSFTCNGAPGSSACKEECEDYYDYDHYCDDWASKGYSNYGLCNSDLQNKVNDCKHAGGVQ